MRNTRFSLLILSFLSACAAADPASQAATGAPVVGAASGGGARTAPRRDVPDGAPGDFLAGRFAAMESDLDRAADEFLRGVAAEPANPELRQQAFLSSLLTGRPEALRLARQEPGNIAAQLLLGGNDARNGNWDAAEKRFAALPKQGLTQVLQPLLLAWCEQGDGRTDTAIATLQPYIDGQRFRAVYALHAGMIADLANRRDDAAHYYHIAETEFGGPNLQLNRTLASFAARTGNRAAAEQTLRLLADASPELEIALPRLDEAVAQRQVRRATDGMAEAYLAMAAALRAQEAGDFAVIMLRLSLDLRPDLTPARLLLAEVVDGGKHPEAGLKVLEPVSDDDPLAPVVRLRVAALTDRAGNSDAALRQLDRLAQDLPNAAEPLAMKGDILREMHRYDDAIVAYDAAVARVPNPTRANWPLFYDRGIAYERAHDWPKAEADFQHALQLSPEQPFVLNYLGYSWTEQGRNLPEAKKMIERAAELMPNDGAIIDSLGWVVLRQGDVPAAVKYLEKAVEMESEDSTINGHLGDAYWAAGRKLEAAYQWHRALSLNPEPEDVPKLEAKVREADAALGMPTAAAVPPPTQAPSSN